MNPSEAMLKLVEEYQNSGKTQKEFCHDHGLKPSTFSYWIKKKRGLDNPEDGFVKIATDTLSQPAIEVVFPNGVKVRATKTDLHFIGQLIRIY